MNNKKIFKKYIVKKSAVILSAFILFCSIVAFICLREHVSKLESRLAHAEDAQVELIAEEIAATEIYKEYVLIVFSIFCSTTLSAIFIERNNANKIVEDVFVNDVFTTDRFWNMLNDEERSKALVTLDSLSHFDGNLTKGEMYDAVRRKINSFEGVKSEYFYEEYYLDVSCTVTDRYIEKRILKKAKVKSFSKAKRSQDFLILAIASPEQNEFVSAQINRVRINGKNLDLKYITGDSYRVENDRMSEKRGYMRHSIFKINKVLDFSNKTPQDIEVEYVTRCPLNDLVYTCRMPCACKKFNFKFQVETEGYVLNPVAFGFIDDAKDSPNHTEDRKNVSLRFEDWIFPQDGVCVYLEKTVAN